jgi:hypothetical protein
LIEGAFLGEKVDKPLALPFQGVGFFCEELNQGFFCQKFLGDLVEVFIGGSELKAVPPVLIWEVKVLVCEKFPRDLP